MAKHGHGVVLSQRKVLNMPHNHQHRDVPVTCMAKLAMVTS